MWGPIARHHPHPRRPRARGAARRGARAEHRLGRVGAGRRTRDTRSAAGHRGPPPPARAATQPRRHRPGQRPQRGDPLGAGLAGSARPPGAADRHRRPTSTGPIRWCSTCSTASSPSSAPAVRARHHGAPHGAGDAGARPVGGRHNAVTAAPRPARPASRRRAGAHAARRRRRRRRGGGAARPQRGNPLFLEELAALVQASGEVGAAARHAAGAWWRPGSTSCRSTSAPCSTTLPSSAPPGTGGLVEFGRALSQTTTRSCSPRWPSRGSSTSRATSGAFRSESRPRGCVPDADEGRPGPAAHGRGQAWCDSKEADQVDAIAHH